MVGVICLALGAIMSWIMLKGSENNNQTLSKNSSLNKNNSSELTAEHLYRTAQNYARKYPKDTAGIKKLYDLAINASKNGKVSKKVKADWKKIFGTSWSP